MPRAFLKGSSILSKAFIKPSPVGVENSDTGFEVKLDVRQGYVMSALLFNLVSDWVMRRTMEDQPRGIRWTPFSTSRDLDFTDDIALLPHTHSYSHETTSRLSTYTHQVGLNINLIKTEVMILKTSNPHTGNVDGEDLPMT